MIRATSCTYYMGGYQDPTQLVEKVGRLVGTGFARAGGWYEGCGRYSVAQLSAVRSIEITPSTIIGRTVRPFPCFN